MSFVSDMINGRGNENLLKFFRCQEVNGEHLLIAGNIGIIGFRQYDPNGNRVGRWKSGKNLRVMTSLIGTSVNYCKSGTCLKTRSKYRELGNESKNNSKELSEEESERYLVCIYAVDFVDFRAERLGQSPSIPMTTE
jgi:hypothetical protein